MRTIGTPLSPSMALSASVRSWASILVAASWLLAVAQGEDGPAKDEKPPTVEEQFPSLHLLPGPWIDRTVYRESVFFVKPGNGKPNTKLLFDAEKILAVHRADAKQTFEVGKDCQL